MLLCCNGLEAARLIKTESPRIKIFLLIAGGDEYPFEEIKSVAEGYLLKPFGARELLTLFS